MVILGALYFTDFLTAGFTPSSLAIVSLEAPVGSAYYHQFSDHIHPD